MKIPPLLDAAADMAAERAIQKMDEWLTLDAYGDVPLRDTKRTKALLHQAIRGRLVLTRARDPQGHEYTVLCIDVPLKDQDQDALLPVMVLLTQEDVEQLTPLFDSGGNPVG